MSVAFVIVAVASAVGAVLAAVYAGLAVRMMRRQMDQLSVHLLLQMSNEHNWHLLDRHRELPAALPAWKNLTDREWAWRILHFNHLNLVRLAYLDRERLGTTLFEGWKRTARYWFSHLASADDEELKEGREMLRQVLSPEEGYTRDFVRWLRDDQIVPEDLCPAD